MHMAVSGDFQKMVIASQNFYVIAKGRRGSVERMRTKCLITDMVFHHLLIYHFKSLDFHLWISFSDDQNKSGTLSSGMFLQCFPLSVNGRSLFHLPRAKLVFGWSLAGESNTLYSKISNRRKKFSFCKTHHYLTILQMSRFQI